MTVAEPLTQKARANARRAGAFGVRPLHRAGLRRGLGARPGAPDAGDERRDVRAFPQQGRPPRGRHCRPRRPGPVSTEPGWRNAPRRAGAAVEVVSLAVGLRALLVEAAAAARTDPEARRQLHRMQSAQLDEWKAIYREVQVREDLDPTVDMDAVVVMLWATELGLGLLEAWDVELPKPATWATRRRPLHRLARTTRALSAITTWDRSRPSARVRDRRSVRRGGRAARGAAGA